ncbi:helix-turn-helix domain-containing protein [Nocardia brasiliensis]|uniref:HTH-type transcriptional regulator RipA n=1 Tax=Nocardia brasiliensis TaxID=37326 RepID=A0A6G9XVN3_NOCBR|nr:helix-turn-helix transcriptional regulator [Nocardia brasiliensis]QIS04994.1 helix-turn-helix domain-containing protein [Nocardia brasiliensis]
MSQNGHPRFHPVPPGPTAMVFGAGVLPAGFWFETHEHPQHQIAWAARGVIAVEVGQARWVLPATRALWIPGGTRHRTGTADGAEMRGIYLEPARCPVTFAAPTMLRVTRLLHELFDHLTAPDTAAAQRERAEAVIFDLLRPVDVIPVGAQPPTDPRAAQVAAALTRDPADDRTLEAFAAEVATSPRTLARLFVSETGITFGHWRTQVRLAASLPLLAAGLPITRIASRVGYATPSAYVAAFRRAVGVSPGRYFSG